MTTWEWVSAVITIAIMAVLAFVFAAVLSACSPVQCVKPVYDIERPVLPEVSRERLQCLDDQTYLDLAERDLLLRSYCEMLEAVVEETTE